MGDGEYCWRRDTGLGGGRLGRREGSGGRVLDRRSRCACCGICKEDLIVFLRGV